MVGRHKGRPVHWGVSPPTAWPSCPAPEGCAGIGFGGRCRWLATAGASVLLQGMGAFLAGHVCWGRGKMDTVGPCFWQPVRECGKEGARNPKPSDAKRRLGMAFHRCCIGPWKPK